MIARSPPSLAALCASALFAFASASSAQESAPSPPPSAATAAPTSAGDPSLRARVAAIVEEHCARCHGVELERQGKRPKGGFGFVDDLARLARDRDYVVAGMPSRSPLYAALLAGADPRMPLGSGQDATKALTTAAIADVADWITSLAADDIPARGDAPLLQRGDDVRAMLHDLTRNVSRRQREQIRFVTLSHLWNLDASEAELEIARQAVAKLLNSLSWQGALALPQPIDPAGTVLRIHLQELGWSAADWDRIVDRYPYGVVDASEELAALQGATKSALPFVRGDWLVAKASLSPLYEQLLHLPTTPTELVAFELDRLGVDVGSDHVDERAARAGVRDSEIATGQRVVERHPGRHGAYWIAWDLKAPQFDPRGADPRRDLFQAPIGPAGLPEFSALRRELCFEPAGSERLFSLPNGLQGYLVLDAAGARLASAPLELVQDPRSRSRKLMNAQSCIACHADGAKPVRDALRDHVLASAAFGRDVKERIEALHPPAAELDRLLSADRGRFRAALAQLGIAPGGPEPIEALALQFEQRLDLRSVAAEMGLEAAALEAQLGGLAAANLAALVEQLRGEGVAREAFTAQFGPLVKALALGQWLAPAALAGGATLPRPAVPTEAPSGAPTQVAGFTYSGRNPQGKHEFRHDKTGLEFVYLEGGTYQQGSPANEPGRGDDEGPVRQVTLAPFLMAKHEVTQEVWERFMRDNPSGFTGDPRLPVETVSWDDAVRFCEVTGLAPAGSGHVALPTEAQWEFACRAGSSGPYPGKLDDLAWYDSNSDRRTHPVGTKQANAFGLHDLQGNVWEWCRDFYLERYSPGPVTDPQGPSNGDGRIYRGGSWGSAASGCRSAYRFWFVPPASFNLLGFRPAVGLK